VGWWEVASDASSHVWQVVGDVFGVVVEVAGG
jgi:hypothetical protein